MKWTNEIDNKMENDTKIVNLPFEIFEAVLQLTPVSQHENFSRVCKYWNDAISDPSMKREVLMDLTNIELAWQKNLGRIFAINAFPNANSALDAYGFVLAMWASRFVSRRTRSLVLSDDLCNKSHILWPEFKPILIRKCPNLREISFQNGQIHLSVLQNLPPTVRKVRLDNVRILKRHPEENYTECLFDLRQTFRDVTVGLQTHGISSQENINQGTRLEDCLLIQP